jgi:hypothetical protein
MPIDVISELRPKSSGQYPIVDIGNVRGSYQSVADLTTRNNINTLSRKIGMIVHIQSTDTNYRLVGGIADSNWQLQIVTSSGLAFTTGFINTASFGVTHSFNYKPNVQLESSGGSLLTGNVTHNDKNSLTINFNKPYTGTVYLS